MTTIVTRAGKGSPLTNTEVDTNFTNLNSAKLEAAVTSVAALTIGTTGTDLSSTVATGTTTPVITLQVPTASTTNRGALSAADWNTFNGKQTALVSGTNIKTVNSTSLLGSGDVSVGVTSVTGTAPVVSSGGATPAISMAAATTFVSGYLTSTDWNTFNGKQPAGSYITSGGALGTPSSGILTNCTFPTLNQNTTGSSGSCTGNAATATTATTANALNTGNGYTGTAFTAAAGGAYFYANRTSSSSGQMGLQFQNAGTTLWYYYVDTSATALTWYQTTTSSNVMSLTTGGNLTVTGQFSGPGTGLTGTAASLSIGGNAATATTAGNVTGTVAVANGGTGLTSAGTSGNVLTSNGSAFTSTAPSYAGQRAQVFTASGTFTVPSGVTAFKVTLCGGGGGGAGIYAGTGGTGGTSSFSTLSSTGGTGGYGNPSGGGGGSLGTPSGSTFAFDPSVSPIYANNSLYLYGGGGPGDNQGGSSPVVTTWFTGLSGTVTVTVGTGGAGSGYATAHSGFVLVEW